MRTLKPAVFVTAALLTAGQAPVAQAATVGASYTCSVLTMSAGVSADLVADLPLTAYTGNTVPSRQVTGTVTLSSSMVSMLRSAGVTALSGQLRDAKYRVGDTLVPLSFELAKTTLPDFGSVDMSGSGTASGYVAPAPGSYPITAPESFVFDGKDQDDKALLLSPTCKKQLSPGTFGTLVVAPKTPSTTKASVTNKPVTTSKRAKVKVRVVAAGQPATGRVKALLKGRKLAVGRLVNGKVTLRLRHLPSGTRKIKIAYLGAYSVAESAKKITVVVKKG